MPKQILIVDDHAIVRQGMARLVNDEPDLEVCAEADSIEEAMKMLAAARPDIAIVDLSLGDDSGLELIKEVKKHYAHIPVLVLSMHDESYYAQRAIRSGAKGYIMKERGPDEIIDAIRQVLSGRVYVSRQVSESLLGQLVGQPHDWTQSPVDRLSDRELEILQLLGKGRTTREVATHLYLSIKTVENHREHIKSKLGLKNANELIRFAVEWVLKN